jgi:ribosomal protein S18 acetylase RimI-like enzyme
MGYVVRRAVDDELDAVGRLTVEAYHADGHVDLGNPYVEELADAASRAREAELWVAVEDGRLLGSVTFCLPGTPWAELSRPGEGEFRMLGVAPAARRRGVAEALVRRVVQRARELDLDALVMCSMSQMTTAHRLYERLGFVRLPERDWCPVPGVELQAFRLELG